MKSYDIIVIGGGPGGYVAAIKASQLGSKVALVEGDRIGGVCLNYGCIPTKTLLKSAKLYEDMLKSASFGIDLGDGASVSVNWKNLMKRKTSVVDKIVGGVEQLVKHNGIDVYKGYASALDAHTVKVNDETITAKNIILATGSTVMVPDVIGLKESMAAGFVVDSTGAINLETQPKTMTILGGGVIAIEFATLFNSLGTEVTILQRSDEILKNLDADVRRTLQRHLESKGVKIITGAQLTRLDGGTVYYQVAGKEESILSDKNFIQSRSCSQLKRF